MSLLKLFDTLHRIDDGFFQPGFFRLADPEAQAGAGLRDPFFEKPSASPLFPFKDDPFEGREDELAAAEAELEGEGEVSLPTEVAPVAAPALGPRVQYSIMTKKEARIGGQKREIVTTRRGDSKGGREIFRIMKRNGKKSVTLNRVNRAGKPLQLKCRFSNVDDSEEEFFLNDWNCFGPFVAIEPGTPILDENAPTPEVEHFDSPSLIAKLRKLDKLDLARRAKKEAQLRAKIAKKEARSARRRAKHEAKRRWWAQPAEAAETPGEGEEAPAAAADAGPVRVPPVGVFICHVTRSSTIGDLKRTMVTKHIRTQDGNESHTVTKSLGGRKITVKKLLQNGVETVTKKYKGVIESELGEAAFMAEYDGFDMPAVTDVEQAVGEETAD